MELNLGYCFWWYLFLASMPAKLCQNSRLLDWAVLETCWPCFREAVHHIISGFSGSVYSTVRWQDFLLLETLNLCCSIRHWRQRIVRSRHFCHANLIAGYSADRIVPEKNKQTNNILTVVRHVCKIKCIRKLLQDWNITCYQRKKKSDYPFSIPTSCLENQNSLLNFFRSFSFV